MKKTNRGFTLIELLAVIIILAIVMVLAAPGVLNAMNTAQEKAAQTQATKFAGKVIEYLDQNSLLGDNIPNSLEPATVGVTLSSGYTAIAIPVLDSSANNYNISKIYITNGSYCYAGVAANVISSTNVTKTKCPTKIEKLSTSPFVKVTCPSGTTAGTGANLGKCS